MSEWRRVRLRTLAARVKTRNGGKPPWRWEQATDPKGVHRVYLRSPRGRRVEVQMRGGVHVRRDEAPVT